MRKNSRTLVVLVLTAALIPSVAVGDSLEDTLGPCDDFDKSVCLFPFPNDYFTVADTATDTGRRVDFSPLAMPKNSEGKPVDPAEWNRNDGFSPGSPILTTIPGIDLEATGAPLISDIGRSLDPSSPILIINARTMERHPFFSELDTYEDPPADRQALILRAAVNFEYGERYIVAMRDLLDSDGSVIPAPEVFRRFRDKSVSERALAKSQGNGRPFRMEEIFETLEQAGVERSSLYLAWEFTVASRRNLTERLLHIRDDGFGSLGDSAPEFTVDDVTNLTRSQDTRIARRIEGRFFVPSYMDKPGGPPGSKFNYAGSDDGLPRRIPGNVQVANYRCNIPRATVSDAADPLSAVDPGSPSLYGHGLLGSRTEVNAGNVRSMGDEHNFVFCATEWQGFAFEDIPMAIASTQDITVFQAMTDRTQQGFLNQLFLGRLMIHQDGFVSHPAFQAGTPPSPLIDTTTLYYDGNSQGGILGGALTAVAQDFTRAVLGVPAMNYSTLLTRSVDFDPFYDLLSASYPDHLDQQLVYGLLQMLWDRAEANGYAPHLTEVPLPNTPSHEVLLHMAFTDHQVANIATETQARTIGARIHLPGVPEGVIPEGFDAFWNIEPIEYPYRGSALIVWWSGNPMWPLGNIPPRPPQYGSDPHGRPRAQVSARLQKAVFLRTGEVIDVCNGGPCLTS